MAPLIQPAVRLRFFAGRLRGKGCSTARWLPLDSQRVLSSGLTARGLQRPRQKSSPPPSRPRYGRPVLHRSVKRLLASLSTACAPPATSQLATPATPPSLANAPPAASSPLNAAQAELPGSPLSKRI